MTGKVHCFIKEVWLSSADKKRGEVNSSKQRSCTCMIAWAAVVNNGLFFFFLLLSILGTLMRCPERLGWNEPCIRRRQDCYWPSLLRLFLLYVDSLPNRGELHFVQNNNLNVKLCWEFPLQLGSFKLMKGLRFSFRVHDTDRESYQQSDHLMWLSPTYNFGEAGGFFGPIAGRKERSHGGQTQGS